MHRVSAVWSGLVALALFVVAAGCATIYKAPEFDSYKPSKIGILPFDVTLDSNYKLNESSREALKIRHRTSIWMQVGGKFWWYQERVGHKYIADIQDVYETMRLLTRATGQPDTHEEFYTKLAALTSSEICEILEVDALIGGKMTVSRPFDLYPGYLDQFKAFGHFDHASINMTIHECEEDKLLWTYKHTARGPLLNTPQDAANLAIASAVRVFPFKRTQ
ncbi:MAG: hypothetical protein OXG08_03190 [Gammaproteobacteria bacterium]|nr:hypothetical protein [Gammaproteobacteria bacterium]